MSALSIKCIFEAFGGSARWRRLGSGGLHLSSRPQQAGFLPTSNNQPNQSSELWLIVCKVNCQFQWYPQTHFSLLRMRLPGWCGVLGPTIFSKIPKTITGSTARPGSSSVRRPERALSTSFEKTCKHHCKHLFSKLGPTLARQTAEHFGNHFSKFSQR